MVSVQIFEEHLAPKKLDDAHQLPIGIVIADQIDSALRGKRIRFLLGHLVLKTDRMPVASPAPIIFDRIMFPVRPYECRPDEQRRDSETDRDNQQDQYLRHRRRIPALNW